MKHFISPYNSIAPRISSQAFIAANTSIIGDVNIGKYTSIWFNCVIRGDVESISIGDNSNIQDGTVIHVSRNGGKTIIGSNVTVGHKALLHACHLQDECFVGMGAIIMDNAVIETGAMVAAGSLVTPNKRVKKNELWAGNPAKFFRFLTEEEAAFIMISANNYRQHAIEYLNFSLSLSAT